MNSLITEHVMLDAYTTFKTGGAARYFSSVSTLEELKAAVVFAQAKQLPFFVIGGGSNVLVPDDGYMGLVILMQIKGISYDSVSSDRVEATFGAGEIFDEVVADTVAKGLWGLENLSHIPGSIGAIPVQNVGAYGVEVADRIHTVSVLNTHTMETEFMSNVACQFGYRDSIFKHAAGEGRIITAVTMDLSRIPQPQLSYADLAILAETAEPSLTLIRDTVISIRSGKFPDWEVIGTAGSFFKNPFVNPSATTALIARYPNLPLYPTADGLVKVSLGFILDKICGLKGYHHNNVGLYEKQALVLVADHGATTSDIIAFADEIAHKVFESTHIKIEREVTLLK